MQALTEPDDVDKLMSKNVGKYRLQTDVSPGGSLEYIVVLQADAIKVSLVDHPRSGLPAEAVAKRLSEGVIHDFRRSESF